MSWLPVGRHQYVVSDAGHAAGQKGYCTDCVGDSSKPEYSYRATVKGTVKELGDRSKGVSGMPILKNIQVLDESVECEITVVNPSSVISVIKMFN